ncbi:hypothetical protein [Maribacter sp. R77961]|uniref:hypothetical protein n=1 Tax=Maribacter sp. R77961 TaxID=3093871 RepID=UPI0037C93181
MGNLEIHLVYRFFARIKFLLSATNQHGVHSPFIYQFVTKGLYRKGTKNYSKTENVLFKCIAYFNYTQIDLVNDSNELKIKLNTIFQGLNYNNIPFDLIYADITSKPFKSIATQNIHNSSMLLLESIYKNKQQTKRWEAIKKLEKVTVTVDLYYCGIVFFRREQAKEHFKIRI